MKFGFICVNASGHLNPIAALARQLQARNHEVIFHFSSDAAGLPVFLDEQNAVPNTTKEARAEASRMQGEDALQFGIKSHYRTHGISLELAASHGGEKWCGGPADR
jgi:hypothetical protein